MRIQRLVLGRTINTGNYESVRADMEMEVAVDENPEAVKMELLIQMDHWEKELKAKYGKK